MEYKRKRKESGQSLTEFALALPILLIILAGVLDLGRLYFTHVVIADAAAEGATYAAIHPNDTDAILQRAQDASGGMVELDPDLVEVVLPPTLSPGSPVVVTVRYEFTMLTPFINLILPEGILMLRVDSTEPILAGEL
jgi:hypothetical protein